MGLKLYSCIVFACIGLNLSANSLSLAQAITKEDIAKALNLAPHEPQVTNIFTRVRSSFKNPHGSQIDIPPNLRANILKLEEAQKRQQFPREADFQAELAKVKIYKHFRAAGGLEIRPFRPELKAGAEEESRIKSARQQLSQAMLDSLKDVKTAELPNCEEDKIDRRKLRLDTPPAHAAQGYDILFLRSYLPKDSDELFGSGVNIIACKKDDINACAIPFGQVHLSCLPTRIRLSAKEIVLLEGQTALKNFSLKPEGVFHPNLAPELKKILGD